MKSINRKEFLKLTGVALGTIAIQSIAAAKENHAPLTIGLCGYSEKSKIAESAGCSYIEEGVAKILVPGEPDFRFKQQLESLSHQPLKTQCFNVFLPAELKSVGAQANHDGIINYAATAFSRAHQIGASIIVFGSSGSRTIPDGFDRTKAKEQFISLCKALSPIAATNKITLAIEQLNKGETNFINTLEESAEIVTAVNHPNVKMICDIYHAMKENDPADQLIRFREHLVHCHIAERGERTPPGTKGDDFTPYFRALKKIEYQGRISLECRWKNLEEELPLAVKVLQAQYEKA